MPASTSISIETPELVATPVAHLVPRKTGAPEDDGYDPSDLSWINKLAAIGDSYSSGIGAGDRLGTILNALDPKSDWTCSRYDHSYPYLINHDERLGNPKKRKFQFESCSGAKTTDVLEKQIPDIDSGQQAILLSIGGNDVELVNILNQCIYQWAVLTEEQVKIAKAAALKGGYDWAAGFEFDHLSRGCQGQLDYAQSLIEGDEFSQNIDKVLTAAKAKLSKDGTIYMTGYGKFFGEELSPECNDVSWSTWLYKAVNLFQPQAMLTADNRRRMNELVDAVNSKLQAAVERAGPSVKFVNYDKYIGQLGGRYCEPGVDESTSESNTRIGLMFYELSTFDFSGSSPWKRSNGDPLNGTFEGSLDVLAQVTLLVDPNADLVHENLVEGKSTAGGIFSEFSSEINKAALDIQVPNLLPDGYGRVFHPQILLHQIITNLVIYNMVNHNQKRNGKSEIPEVLSISACPYDPPSSTIPDLPTLPPLTTTPPATFPIESPKGSSCLKTATKEVCTVPREPCATSLSCEKWTATPTAPSLGKVTCFPENRRPVAKYGPINHPEFEGAAGAACDAFNAKGEKFWDKSEAHSWAWEIVDRKTTYWFNIGWEAGCTLPNNDNPQSQHMIYPLGKDGHICEDIFINDILQSCADKGGRGGHIKAGCLVYAFEPCDTDDCFNTGKGPPSMAPDAAPRNG